QQANLKRVALQKNVALTSAIILLIFGLTLFRNIMLKRKNDQHLRELAEHELQIQKLEGEKVKVAYHQQKANLEMQALRAQMNPHFIFNCLNAINHFILKNENQAAASYLTKFSRLVRLVLQTSSQKTVSLFDEMEMLRFYIELEQMRFKKQFTFDILYDPELEVEDIFIPPLLLQPFVENAIWHGLMHSHLPGHLAITLQLKNNILYCTITDNGIGRQKAADLKSKSASSNKSMGLQITANRLKLLNQEHNDAFFLQIKDLKNAAGEGCGTEVKIKIPISTKQFVTA
ncbi:MAG TPA: histidine kinase, partial [Flavisolibacter sp.]|nr:histidine kinase [Flavisolibacter sp.]